MPVVEVAAYASRHEAELARGWLATHGITSVLRTDDAGGARPDLAPRSGVGLLVRDEDVPTARSLLGEVLEGRPPSLRRGARAVAALVLAGMLVPVVAAVVELL